VWRPGVGCWGNCRDMRGSMQLSNEGAYSAPVEAFSAEGSQPPLAWI